MPGNYRLRVTLPNGYVVVEKDDTRLKDGQNISVMTTYTAREGESDLIALRMSQHQPGAEHRRGAAGHAG